MLASVYDTNDFLVREIERLELYSSTLEESLKNVLKSPVLIPNGLVVTYHPPIGKWVVRIFDKDTNSWPYWVGSWESEFSENDLDYSWSNVDEAIKFAKNF